jgi:hypothetical protein
VTRRQVAYFSIAGALVALGAGFSWASGSELARQVVELTAAGIPRAQVCNVQPGTLAPPGQMVVSEVYDHNRLVGWFDGAGNLILCPPRHAQVSATEFVVATMCAADVAWLGALTFLSLAFIIRPSPGSQPNGFPVVGHSKG